MYELLSVYSPLPDIGIILINEKNGKKGLDEINLKTSTPFLEMPLMKSENKQAATLTIK
jgi:hypothetical protein